MYIDLLPAVLPFSTFLGFFSGLTFAGPSFQRKQFGLLVNVIGHTTIGFVTGVLYPISFPLMGGYVIYKTIETP